MVGKRLFFGFLAVLVALVLLAGNLQAQTGNRGRSNFDWIVARRITITPLGLSVAGDTTLADATADDVTADDVTVTTLTAADVTVSSGLTLTAQTAISVTNGAVITPTGALQVLESAGTVTPTLAIPNAGVTICLYNRTNTTINLADTGNQVLAGAFAMGQYDALCGWSDGTRFVELSRSNN